MERYGSCGKKLAGIVALALAAALTPAAIVRAATFNVTTAAELQGALTAAQANGEADTIRVAESATPYVGNFTYAPAAGENHDLTILGGWNGSFTGRDPNPDETVLDGDALGRVLGLTCPNNTTGSVRVEGLWLRNGKTTGDALSGGGLYVKTAAPGTIAVVGNYISGNAVEMRGGGLYVDAAGGPVVVEGNQIQGNTASSSGDGNLNLPFAGGAFVLCWGGCTIVNNLIIGNSTSDSVMGGGKGGGLMILARAGTIDVTNNTITGNEAYTFGGGLYLGPSGPTTALHFNLYNNIIRGNKTSVGWRGDHDIQNGVCESDPPLGHTVTIDHNNYQYLGDWDCVKPTVTIANNINADPLFAAGPGYQLQSTSPCVDAGNNAAPGLPAYDCYGDPRKFAYKNREVPVVDMGWDEYADWALDITAPEAHSYWRNDGTAKSIAWECSNIGGTVNLSLWKGPDREHSSKVKDINPGVPVRCDALGASWTIPADVADGEDYAVVISSALYPVIERAAVPITILAPPRVASSVRLDANPTALASVSFVVTFSGAVTGVDASDFTLTTSGLSGAAVTGVTGSGAGRTVTVSTGTGNGTLRLDVADDDSIVDAAGNPLGGVGAGNGAFTGGEAYTVNKSATMTLLSVGTYDGWILEASETKGKGGSLNARQATFSVGDDGANRQRVSILDFDTSSLPPGAVVTAATLKIKKQGSVGRSPFTTHGKLLADVRAGFFGTARTLAIADFQAPASKAAVAAFGKTAVAGWHSAVVGGAGLASINGRKTAQFRLRFVKDDNNDRAENAVRFYSGNAALAARPQLVVTYTLP